MASQASSKSKSSSAMSSGGDTTPPARANQRTILDDIILTFSSPMAWLLVVALVITWTAVAVVLFDLLDYKTLAGLPPPPAIAKRGLKARGGVRQIRSPISEVAPPQESTDWLEMMWTFAAGLVAPDEEDIDEGVEGIHQLTETFTSLHSEEL